MGIRFATLNVVKTSHKPRCLFPFDKSGSRHNMAQVEGFIMKENAEIGT